MIATIINYCTNDYRFLSHCVREAKVFSSQIIVPVCDHFFNGEPENVDLLHRSYIGHPDVDFVEFAFDDRPYGIYSSLTKTDPDWIHFWHSTARYVGFASVRSDIEWVLFLDVDEIVDGKRMQEWLGVFPKKDTAFRFTTFFYFREARFQATKLARCGLLVKKEAITHELLLDVDERRGVFNRLEGEKWEDVYGLDGQPLFHHYSWVKTKEEMLKKVRSWGHHLDKDWEGLIFEEFSAPFRGTDCLYGLTYREVEPFCDVLTTPRVKKVTRLSLFCDQLLKS